MKWNYSFSKNKNKMELFLGLKGSLVLQLRSGKAVDMIYSWMYNQLNHRTVLTFFSIFKQESSCEKHNKNEEAAMRDENLEVCS